jgi:Tfp pilus assembly protein FimT
MLIHRLICPEQNFQNPVKWPSVPFSSGISLIETLWVVCLTGLITAAGSTALGDWLLRIRIESARTSWANDLQTARLKASTDDVSAWLERLTDCNTSLGTTDWSCGWRLRTDAGVMQETRPASGVQVLVNFNPPQSLQIDNQGDPVSGGASVVFRAQGAKLSQLSQSLCLNVAGRLRWVSGESCS